MLGETEPGAAWPNERQEPPWRRGSEEDRRQDDERDEQERSGSHRRQDDALDEIVAIHEGLPSEFAVATRHPVPGFYNPPAAGLRRPGIGACGRRRNQALRSGLAC